MWKIDYWHWRCYTIIQWVTENIRIRVDKPSRLKPIINQRNISRKKYWLWMPLWKEWPCDPGIEIKEDMEIKQDDSYEKNKIFTSKLYIESLIISKAAEIANSGLSNFPDWWTPKNALKTWKKR